MSFENTMTGAYMYEKFRADANLDGKFDEKDSLTGYNLYCLMSPASFSCGNMAVSILKDSHIVTMNFFDRLFYLHGKLNGLCECFVV